MITGARHGTVSGLRRLVAFAMTRNPGVFIIPGPEIARINDLDIQAAGMEIVASPRHASILLVIGEIPDAMREAAAVIYAQMMRPRVLLFLTEGIKRLPPLPTPDFVAGISQLQLLEAMQQLRTALAKSAFHTYGSDFDAPILQIRIEYTCSMHPEIIQDEPGSCPKCGMDLIQREAQATAVQSHAEHQKMQDDDHSKMDHQKPLEYTCPMHPEVVEMEPGSCPKCGMNLEPRETSVEYTCPMHPEVIETEPGSCPKCGMDLEPREQQQESAHQHHNMDHESTIQYTCPMHPEVLETEPGSCPKCGMNLEPREASVEYTCPMHPEVIETEPGSCPKCGMNLEPRDIENTSHDHASGEHGDMDMDFMSMIEMTKDLPRSIDELPMEWINVPFGPFFPGLAGGLLLTLTLDGDTVAGSSIDTLVGNEPLMLQAEMDSVSFIERLASLEPLAPICYQVLACQAIENAAGLDVEPQIAKARIVAMEQERIVSHLGWLILFAEQTGFEWLLRRATILQRDFLSAGIKQIVTLKSAVIGLNKKLSRTPLLNSRTRGIARLMPTSKSENTLLGPVARASGVNNDARANNIIYNELGFKPIITNDGDARARLQLRLDEISQSLALIESMGFACNSVMNVYAVNNIAQASGQGEAEVETARGMARLQLSLEKGQIVSAQMTTPSTQHAALIEQLIDQQELGDALVAISSLDLSPWEMRQ